jgi:HAMP domain-containing protein
VKPRRIPLLFLGLTLFFPAGIFCAGPVYWDNPVDFSPASGSFPQTAVGPGIAAAGWQEVVNGKIYITVAVNSEDASTENAQAGGWKIYGRVAGPYSYSFKVPSIFTMSADRMGRIFVCAASSTSTADILILNRGATDFEKYTLDFSGLPGAPPGESLAPRIFQMADNSTVMFTLRSGGGNLSLYYARSEDGYTWPRFERFAPENSLRLNFLPAHAAIGGTDYIVFQSLIAGTLNRPSYQLFLKSSGDGGRTWSAPRRVTEFNDPVMNVKAHPDVFNNERADMISFEGKLFLVWERRDSAGASQIYGLTLDRDGNPYGTAERVNSVSAHCSNPVAVEYEGEPAVLWFDNRAGKNGAFMAMKNGSSWRNTELSRFSEEALFVRAATVNGVFYVFWQETSGGASRIVILPPDRSVPTPELTAVNFTAGKREALSSPRINWKVPYDSSGIKGYSWTWNLGSPIEPKREVAAMVWNTSAELPASLDGEWFFSLIAQDNAGNWSPPAVTSVIRDTTPPPAVKLIPPETDETGSLASNTFTVRWTESEAGDLAGYAWELDFIAPPGAPAAAAMRKAPAQALRNRGMATSASFVNEDNGWYRFTVYPIDNVGNTGEPSSIVFRLNKYIPHTFISLVNYGQDIQGVLSMEIIGRGFLENGAVSDIFFRKNGADARALSLERGDFAVDGDTKITVSNVEHLDEGDYHIVVRHPLRGDAVSAELISVQRTVTVKFGDFTNLWTNSWVYSVGKQIVFDVPFALVYLFFAFFIILTALALVSIVVILDENKAIRVEAFALLNEELMPAEKKRQALLVKKRVSGLRLKFASFILAIVLFIVIMFSIPMFLVMSRTQQQTLMTGLMDRSVVLLEALTRSARVFLPSNSALELGYLPQQIASVPEARYTTITGFGIGGTSSDDYVWASNDPDILKKINTAVLSPGVSRIKDDITPFLGDLNDKLNEKSRESVTDLVESIDRFNRESLSLLLSNDDESRRRLEDVQVTTRDLESRVALILDEIGSEVQSYPAIDIDRMDTLKSQKYILYKPVMFHQGLSGIYVRGMVRLEISNETILQEIRAGQRSIMIIILYVALVAALIGGIGAMVLSTLIIRPIRSLVRHVERIRDTENKAELEGVDIVIKTRDELAILAETINDMTRGLVTAAKAAEDLSIGKEIQKKFIPLETDKDENKLTYGSKTTKTAKFFGYYEGAKGVSGDYFDYQDIDGRYFAIIKCDVAGKGVPAALIMAQVATMFRNYFKTWEANEAGMHIETLVYLINDFIETLGFKGRFAAFTLCLFDSEKGIVHFCNAGDNLVHLYDLSERRLKTITLPQSPAVGVLPNSLLEASGAYQIQTLKLDHGDMLLLYTDGIEEAKCMFRDADYNEIICAYDDMPNGTPHGGHFVGQNGEELGAKRVEDIINAVMNKQEYILYKYHNPLGEVYYHFDFSACRGTVEEVIMAMVSIEKLFRMYIRPGLADERVLVDGKVNSFLRDYFIEYHKYCNVQNHPENPMYVYYTGMSEDEQYDDLTILGLRWR